MTSRPIADAARLLGVLALAALGACARVPAAARSAGGSPKSAACFGAGAEALVSDEPGAKVLRFAGGRLYWTPGPRGYAMSQIDLTSLRVEHSAGKHVGLDTMDARQSFWTTSINDLEVADLATMKVSVLVSGHDRMEDPIVWSSLAIDDAYVYYGRDAYRSLHAAGLFRMRRDGAGKEERIAPRPGLDRPFIGGGGFVYWFDRFHEKAALLRRALTPGAPEQLVTWLPSYDPKAFMALAGPRLYFVDRGALWSVPVDGSAPPVQQLVLGNSKVADLIVEPPCLYYVSDGRIERAALDADSSQIPETIADDQTFGGGDVVTDGRFLYWTDGKRGRIMRAGPSPQVVPARDELLAKPAPEQPRRPVRPSSLALADGWGCVLLSREAPAPPSWECWRAVGGAAGGSPVIAARPVVKLAGNAVAAERDQVCLVVGSQPRCWTWNQLMDGAPADFRPEAAERPAATLSLGGSFRCTDEAQTLRCSGDNRYGQLANGSGGDDADQSSHSYHADGAVLGDWHGCQMRTYAGTYCWGRGDAGQLGFPAPDTCRVGGQTIPCSTKPRRLPVPDDQFRFFRAGDMFTCAATDHLTCWGGSRDGAFGTAAECPAALRGAWPTLTGTVAAPRATCARAPVDLPGFAEQKRGRGLLFDVGARGICALVEGQVRCIGAIPTPRLPAKPLYFAIQRGDQPAGCAYTEHDVYCWGAGYSPADDLAAPVRIALEAQSDRRSGAPIFDPPPRPGGWEPDCAAHFACEVATKPLPACASGAAAGAVSWHELADRAAHLANQTIQVRGPLVLGPEVDESCYMGERCCHGRHRRAIALGGAERKLALEGLWCTGDGSRLCCSAPAYGQPVIATGKLVDVDGRWTLKPAAVCLDEVGR